MLHEIPRTRAILPGSRDGRARGGEDAGGSSERWTMIQASARAWCRSPQHQVRACSTALTRSRVNGTWRTRAPVASKIALPIAAATIVMAVSPAPVASSSGRLIRTDSIVGRSDHPVQRAVAAPVDGCHLLIVPGDLFHQARGSCPEARRLRSDSACRQDSRSARSPARARSVSPSRAPVS